MHSITSIPHTAHTLHARTPLHAARRSITAATCYLQALCILLNTSSACTATTYTTPRHTHLNHGSLGGNMDKTECYRQASACLSVYSRTILSIACYVQTSHGTMWYVSTIFLSYVNIGRRRRHSQCVVECCVPLWGCYDSRRSLTRAASLAFSLSTDQNALTALLPC